MDVNWWQSQAEALREVPDRHLSSDGPGDRSLLGGTVLSQAWGWWQWEVQLTKGGYWTASSGAGCDLNSLCHQTRPTTPTQHWIVCDLTWQALQCLLSVDFSSLVRLPGNPSVVAWLTEKNTVAGNSNSSFCLMHLMEEKLKSQTNMQPDCTS